MAIHDWPGRDALPPVQRWTVSATSEVYRDRRISVEQARVSAGAGQAFSHQVIRFAAQSVAAVVHNPGRGVLMLYRHRFITDTTGLSVPAGGVSPGEDPVDAAYREVFEETGCKLGDARLMASADVLPGAADKRFHFVYGTAGHSLFDPADAHESTALYWVPAGELFELMASGLICAQPSMLALLYAERAGLLGLHSRVTVMSHRSRTRERHEHHETWDGGLTVSADRNGADSYDFGSRAELVSRVKSELGLPGLVPLPSPWTLEIQPTLLCNARCHFCSYEELITGFRNKQRTLPAGQRTLGLPWGRIQELLGEVSAPGTTRELFWSGGGEPLVWPRITDAIARSAEFAHVSLQTNGIRLGRLLADPPAMQNISVLSVSVYSDLRQQHKQIAGVDSFDRVSRNLQHAIRARDSHSWDLTIGVKILVDRNNFNRLPQIIRYYRELGADSVALREVQGSGHGSGSTHRPIQLLGREREQVRRQASAVGADPALILFARALSGTHGILPVTRHCYNATDGHFACVDPMGEVYLGNPEIGDTRYSIGNIQASSWHQIWRSARHREVIKLMDQLQQTGLCSLRACRHVRANLGAELAAKRLPGRDADDTDQAMGKRPLDSFL